METFRRMAQGQLAEMGGKSYVELDFFMHLLEAPRLVQQLAAPYRARRIKAMLEEKEKLDREDFKRIQSDFVIGRT